MWIAYHVRGVVHGTRNHNVEEEKKEMKSDMEGIDIACTTM